MSFLEVMGCLMLLILLGVAVEKWTDWWEAIKAFGRPTVYVIRTLEEIEQEERDRNARWCAALDEDLERARILREQKYD
jgi:hypothetical protein